MLYNRPLQMSNGRILFIAGGCIMLSIAFFLKEKEGKEE